MGPTTRFFMSRRGGWGVVWDVVKGYGVENKVPFGVVRSHRSEKALANVKGETYVSCPETHNTFG